MKKAKPVKLKGIIARSEEYPFELLRPIVRKKVKTKKKKTNNKK